MSRFNGSVTQQYEDAFIGHEQTRQVPSHERTASTSTSTSTVVASSSTYHTLQHQTNAPSSISIPPPHTTTTTLAPSRTSPLRADTTTTTSAATSDSAHARHLAICISCTPSQLPCRARCKISSSTMTRKRRVRSASRNLTSPTRASVRVPVATRSVTYLHLLLASLC